MCPLWPGLFSLFHCWDFCCPTVHHQCYRRCLTSSSSAHTCGPVCFNCRESFRDRPFWLILVADKDCMVKARLVGNQSKRRWSHFSTKFHYAIKLYFIVKRWSKLVVCGQKTVKKINKTISNRKLSKKSAVRKAAHSLWIYLLCVCIFRLKVSCFYFLIGSWKWNELSLFLLSDRSLSLLSSLLILLFSPTLT